MTINDKVIYYYNYILAGILSLHNSKIVKVYMIPMILFLTSTEGVLISVPLSINKVMRSLLSMCRARSKGVRPS